MSDNSRTVSLVRNLREQFRSAVNSTIRKRLVVCFLGLVTLGTGSAIADVYLHNLFPFFNFNGFSGTYSSAGSVDLSGPFFQSLGTNGRTCETCHQPSDAFGLSAVNAQLRYFFTRGKDPLFAQFDGSTCPTGPINNSLVLNNGLIRIPLTVPPNTTDSLPPQLRLRPFRIRMVARSRPTLKGSRSFRSTDGLCQPRISVS